MNIAKYLLARLIEDPIRQEAKNFGIIVWSQGTTAARFLGYTSTGKPCEGSFPRFVTDSGGYKEWVQFWLDLLATPDRLSSSNSQDFFEMLRKTARGPVEFLEGRVNLEDPAEEWSGRRPLKLEMLADHLFEQLILERQESLASRVMKWPILCAAEAERQHRRNLRDLIGRILERFRATSAWLFVLREGKLFPVITQNSGALVEPILLDGLRSIVAHTAISREAYCAPDTQQDGYYLELIQGTRSEMAVPLLTNDRELLGVLNLEATEPNLFSQAQLIELQSRAMGLIPYVLLLNRALPPEGKPREIPFGWQFHRHGWGSAQLLQDFAFHIIETLGVEGIRPTCTIWYMDREKNELWVRATAGFDTEYVAFKSLSSDSFTGDVVRAPRNTVFKGRLQDFPRFLRKEKAETMGLKRIHATPIYLPASEQAYGSLNMYFFSDAGDVADSLLLRLADTIGRLIHEHENLQVTVATQEALSRLTQKSLAAAASFDDVREILCECFNTRFCTIFAKTKTSRKLKCVSTTGIESAGRPIRDFQRVVYDLDRDRGGFTEYLANHPNFCLRRNHLLNPTEPGPGGEIVATNRFPEQFAFSTHDQQRFLGFSPADDEDVLGVIRLVRPSGGKPFLESDRRLIAAIAESSKQIFRNWREQERHSKSARRLLSKSKGKPRPHAVVEAFANIIRPIDANCRPDRLATRLLHDIFGIFAARHPLLGSVRELVSISETKDECARQELRFFAFHAASSGGIGAKASAEPEVLHSPQRLGQKSIAWLCLEEWKIISFESPKCGDYFKPTHEDSASVRSGVCIPLITWTHGKPVKWVLSLDFAKSMPWSSADMEFLLYATRKLSAILVDTIPIFYDSAEEFFRAFSGLAMREAEITWMELRLNSRKTGAPKTVIKCRRGDEPLGEFSPVEAGAVTDYGVGRVSTRDGDAYRVALRCGPFPVGSCMFGKRSQAVLAREVSTIMKAWSNFPGVVGGAAEYWEANFTPRLYVPQPGITIWDTAVFWTPPQDFPSPIHVSF